MFRVAATFALAAVAFAAPSVTFAPATLPSSGSTITVKWSGVSSPSNGDLLAVRGTTAGGYTLKTFGFFAVNGSSTWQTGSGVISFPLVNLRATQYSFVYVQVRETVPCVHDSCLGSPCVAVVHVDGRRMVSTWFPVGMWRLLLWMSRHTSTCRIPM
jgi:hypothetical protein